MTFLKLDPNIYQINKITKITFSSLAAAGGNSTQNLLVSSASTAATAAPLLCFSPIDKAMSSLAPNSCVCVCERVSVLDV